MQIALIPARGGSKRIPRKNIREFAGKPMIGWAVAAAQSSGLFDHVIVSTDDDEIAEVARQVGAEVPFMRPDALADDFTPPAMSSSMASRKARNTMVQRSKHSAASMPPQPLPKAPI